MPDPEQYVDQKTRPAAGQPVRATHTPDAAQLPQDVTRAFERIEKLLGRIHGALDASAREGEHRELSYGRLLGGILQVVVAGLLALALLDWLLHGAVNSLFVKLAFAGVLQVSALTAFVVARKSS
jgi:hypothetical protein